MIITRVINFPVFDKMLIHVIWNHIHQSTQISYNIFTKIIVGNIIKVFSKIYDKTLIVCSIKYNVKDLYTKA